MTERRDRFRQIYDDNYERILGYALRRTDTVEDAHDVVSETFLAAWRRLDDVPAGPRSRLWLYGTARNAVANHYRGRQRQRRLDTKLRGVRPGVLEGSAAPSEPDELPAVATAFSRLGDSDRELLLLVGWEGLDASELAEVLGCTRATARVRLHRARRRFAAQLDAEGVARQQAPGHQRSEWSTTRRDAEEAL